MGGTTLYVIDFDGFIIRILWTFDGNLWLYALFFLLFDDYCLGI